MTIHRRKFLAVSFGVGTAVAAGAWGTLQFSSKTDSSAEATTRRSHALGSEVSIQILGLPSARAERALDAAFAAIEEVESVMSLYRPDSQICRLNRDRQLSDPHADFVTVLNLAREVSQLSEGAFDISVQPLWQLYADAQKANRQPSLAETAAAVSLVKWEAVDVSTHRVRLHAPVMAITLNGIAQGFAADRALSALKQHGVTQALVNTGEISSLGSTSASDWKVGIQHPRATDSFIALAMLRDRALATSGDYESTFSSDFSVHHIFDPQTGLSPTELSSVSIAAPTSMQADALSTAAMVLGPDRTMELVAKLQGVDALLVLKNGRTLQTKGFPSVDA